MNNRNSSKREIILHTAEKLFLEKRFDQVTLEEVREKAKVGKGTIYLYYKSKEDLYAQVLLSGMDELHRGLERQAAGKQTPDSKLGAMLDCLCRFFRSRRHLFRSLYAMDAKRAVNSRELHTQFQARRAALVQLVAQVIQEGIDSGLYRQKMDAALAARMVLGAAREVFRDETRNGQAEFNAMTLSNFVLNGLR